MNIGNLFRRMAACTLAGAVFLVGIPFLSLAETAEETPTPPQTVKIACVGASTTVGVGSEDGTSYPSDLQAMLGGLCEVRNFGYSGCTVIKTGRDTEADTPGMCAYIGSDIHRASLDYEADIVLVMMGGNDSKPVNWNGGDNTFEADYEELLRSYTEQENAPLVVVATSSWIQTDRWGITDSVTSEEIVPIQKRVAEKLGLTTVSMRDVTYGHNEYYSSDGVHLNSAGYQAIAGAFYDTLVALDAVPEGSENYLFKPTTASFDGIFGTYDGYEVLQWVNGQTGYFSYPSGTLAAAFGVENGTIAEELSITVSYYWDHNAGGNDWWHFNTTDENGLSAPGVANDNPHDSGFGTFTQYGMQVGGWHTLTVTRERQQLGSGSADWYINVGDLNAANSLYIRGFSITAKWADGTETTRLWGVPTADEAEPEPPKEVLPNYDPILDYSGYDKVKIACVGASTTQGNDGYSYPGFLQTMLGGKCEVRNFGYPGCTVMKNQPYSYIGSSYYTDSLAYQADIVIIAMGGNDSQPPFWKDGNNTFKEDYDELINAYRSQGNTPLILISNGGTVLKASWGIDDSVIENGIMPIQREIAETYNIPTANLREVLLGHEEYFIEDGVHYNAAGYKAMAQLYYDTLLACGVKFPAGSKDTLWDPSGTTVPDFYGSFDGYDVMQWKNGATGSFSYDGNMIGAALGLTDGTVVSELSIAVTYYYDFHAEGGDWWHFSTYNADGTSYPSLSGTPNDQGFGGFSQYGLKKGEWAELVVTRENQQFGGGHGDWLVNVGMLNAANSLYIRGFTVTATLEDGTVVSTSWGAPLTPAVTPEPEPDPEPDPALTGDVDGDGEITSTDARLTLQFYAGKIGEDDLDLTVADVDGDDNITSTDARLILQKYAGKIEAFPTK